MRIAFMGTPAFSVPALSELIASTHDLVAVYSQPPRKSGRGQKLNPSPVHSIAAAHNIEVRTPINFKSKEDVGAFEALELDVAIVIAYGLILPESILQAPTNGCLNLHASLLPRWRGAAPVQRAIMAGDQATGIQLMQMEAGLDTGPILLSETVPIELDDTSASLHDKLSMVGATLLPRALAALDRGALHATLQNEEGVTYAHKIASEEAKIDWHQSAQHVDYHIRGMSPFPGAWFEITSEDRKKIRCKALMSKFIDQAHSSPAGSILKADSELVIACQEGAVSITQIQRAGKAAQSAEVFLRGLPLPVSLS